MISSIIDFIIDLSNTFDSLTRSLFNRFRSYKSFINNKNKSSISKQELFKHFPKIAGELSRCKHLVKYILITNSINKNKIAYEIVFLNTNMKLVHSFNILLKQSEASIALPNICYWEL